MHQNVINFKSLFLSEEETMALLDLCLTSSSEIDAAKEQAIQKLTELARKHLRDTENREMAGNQGASFFQFNPADQFNPTDQLDPSGQLDPAEPGSAQHDSTPLGSSPCDELVVSSRTIGAILRREVGALGPEGLSQFTMMARSMARSHATRCQMGTALADCRRRLRKRA